VLAFHEAFADIVALMQHFTMREVLAQQIAKTRGDLESESMLGTLALQFGRSTGQRGGLRDAIGTFDGTGRWKRIEANPGLYKTTMEPHARGALLVAAVFDAFLAIYKMRSADLYRLATGGTGVLPGGAIHPDLVNRLAAEASKSAAHVLRMCIRALDYVPPVDITFGEYLRGIITADADLVADDPLHYRVAFIEAFRRRGLYPADLATLSFDSLLWRGADLPMDAKSAYMRIVNDLKTFADECLYIDNRELLWNRTRDKREDIGRVLREAWEDEPDIAKLLGIDPTNDFDVHELRRAERTSPNGTTFPQHTAPSRPSHQFRVNCFRLVVLSQIGERRCQGGQSPQGGGLKLPASPRPTQRLPQDVRSRAVLSGESSAR
jgi:hypothetical protein